MGIFNIFRKKNIQEEQSNSSKNKFNFVDPLSQKEETTLEDYTVCKSALNGILKKLEELGYYEEKIEECEKRYFKCELPCIFKVTDENAHILDDLLKEREYQVVTPTDVMILNMTK